MLIGSIFLLITFFGVFRAVADNKMDYLIPALVSLILGAVTIWLGKRQYAVESKQQVEDKSINQTEYEIFPTPVSKTEFEHMMQEEELSSTYTEVGPGGPGTRKEIYVNGNVLSVRTTDMEAKMSKLNLIDEEYKTIYSFLEEGCSRTGTDIDSLWFNIGKEVRAPGMRGCVKKQDGWYYYEYDDHAYLVGSVGPIKELDMFLWILCLKLGISTEKYKITRENMREVAEVMHKAMNKG